MKKFLKLFLLTALMTLAMSVIALAEEPVTESTTLAAGDHTDIIITGSSDSANPLIVTIPEEGINAQNSAANKPCITIQSGYVKLTGGSVYHKNATAVKAEAIIKVNDGAELTLENIKIYGRGQDVSGTPDSSDATQTVNDGISVAANATLNINNGTEITNINTYDTYVFASTIYSYGTVNMNGGSIHTNTQRSGAAIIVMGGVTNIHSGTIYGNENSNNALYNMRGELNINGGLMVGNLKGVYNNNGEFNSGVIATQTGGTITDRSDSDLTVSANQEDTLIANPAHNLVTTINGKEHTGVFAGDKWHFYSAADEHAHEIDFNTAEINLSTKAGNNTAELVAKVLCTDGHTDLTWSTDESPLSTISYETPVKTPGDDATSATYVVKITAKKAGTVVLTATSHNQTTATCTINVTDPKNITTTTTLVAGQTYEDCSISGNITVTIPEEGIYAASSNSSDCITITGGSVTITGGPIYHKDGHGNVSTAIIKVNQGASLTLNNAIIDGSEGPNSDISEPVQCGIHNEGNLYIQNGSIIRNINIDQDTVLETDGDAAVHNANSNTGTHSLQIDDSYIYGNTGYAVSGRITSYSGDHLLVVGDLASDSNFDGSVYSTGKIIGIIGNTVKYEGDSVEATAKIGDTLVAHTGATLVSEIDGAAYHGKYNTTKKEWEFEEKTNGIASYAKGKNTVTNPNASDGNKFESSHVKDGETISPAETETAEVPDNSSIATAFKDENLKAEGDTAYILFEVHIPSGTTDTYARASENNVKNHSGITTSVATGEYSTRDGSGESTSIWKIKTKTSDDYVMKYKMSAPNTAGNTFGLIIENLYSTEAYAYIEACTQEDFNNATDYTDITNSGSATATVSLF